MLKLNQDPSWMSFRVRMFNITFYINFNMIFTNS